MILNERSARTRQTCLGPGSYSTSCGTQTALPFASIKRASQSETAGVVEEMGPYANKAGKVWPAATLLMV